MKIGVIGLGWLGKAIASQLKNNGFDVWGTYRTNQPDFQPSFQLDTDLPEATHLVLCFPPSRSTNFPNEVEAIVRRFPSELKVILISSTSVYSEENEVCEESLSRSAFNLENLNYLAEQRLAELLGENLTVIRMAGLVGGNRFPVVFMSQSGKEYAGKDQVNLIHQVDAVNLIQFVLEKDEFGKTINGCSSEHPSKKEYYSWMAEKLQINAPKFSDSTSAKKIISNNLSKELGFVYSYSSPFDFL
jgi:nucleoside-diphosphate-sugar epimerase